MKCPECNGGISYVDHSKPVHHPYHLDHMNAHLCTRCSGTGKVSGRRIIVNGTKHEVSGTRTLNYADVVRLAEGRDVDALLSVTYKRAGGKKTEGCLSPGESVEIQEGTVFNAYRTGNA